MSSRSLLSGVRVALAIPSAGIDGEPRLNLADARALIYVTVSL
ncbi:MAG: hypothetical protein ACRDK2_11705 [Solirubrobacteraceae bacterium]